MSAKIENLRKKAALFSLTPLALACVLAVHPVAADAQTATYEYTGKWVADDYDPSMPPFLQGLII